MSHNPAASPVKVLSFHIKKALRLAKQTRDEVRNKRYIGIFALGLGVVALIVSITSGIIHRVDGGNASERIFPYAFICATALAIFSSIMCVSKRVVKIYRKIVVELESLDDYVSLIHQTEPDTLLLQVPTKESENERLRLTLGPRAHDIYSNMKTQLHCELLEIHLALCEMTHNRKDTSEFLTAIIPDQRFVAAIIQRIDIGILQIEYICGAIYNVSLIDSRY